MRYLFLLFLPFILTSCHKKEFRKLPPNRGPHRPVRPKLPRKQANICTKKPLVIAVVDTGFGYNGLGKDAKLCKFGHKDFTSNQELSNDFDTKDPIPVDHHKHGTNVAGIIQQYADISNNNYCLVILKYTDPKEKEENNLLNTVNAFRYAINIKADYINYSGGGTGYNPIEEVIVESFIKKGGKFIAAAGNENSDIDKIGKHYYPAYYSNVISVGNLSQSGNRVASSNYGKSIKIWEVGENIKAYGLTMTGTSQATAVVTGKLVAKENTPCN